MVFEYLFIRNYAGVVEAAIQGHVDCVDYSSHLVTPSPSYISVYKALRTAVQLPGLGRNARTSTGARQAMTALRPHSCAFSMSAASSIQKPPMCSLVSRYG